MASAGSHVWVGFIEALPVVGSVKEAVEWVLAVAADDSALAKEKLDVINGRLRRELNLKENRSSGSSSGYSSQSTSGSSTPVGKKSSGLTAMHVESKYCSTDEGYGCYCPSIFCCQFCLAGTCQLSIHMLLLRMS